MSEAFDLEVLAKLRLVLEPAVSNLARVPSEVQPASLLAAVNNRLGHPYLLTNAVSGAYTRAWDHLGALHNLLFKSGNAHACACMTMARAALENAAVALWLLGTDDETERCRRVMCWSFQNFKDEVHFFETMHDELAEGYDPQMVTGLEADIVRLTERRDAVLVRAASLGFGPKDVRGAWWRSIFQAVGSEGGYTGLTPHLQWKSLSGVAHGRDYAGLRFLRPRIVADVPHDPKNAVVELTINEENFYGAVLMVRDLLTRSRKIYDSERLAFKEHAPPDLNRHIGLLG
ncbi:MAG: hypothetical protein U0Q19_10070 [Kineosporiaceae bacterium]